MAALAEEFFKNLSTKKRDQLLSGLATIGVNNKEPEENVSRKRKRSGQSLLSNTSTSASSSTTCQSSFDDDVIVLSSDSEEEAKDAAAAEDDEGEVDQDVDTSLTDSHLGDSPTSVNGDDAIEYTSNSDEDVNVSVNSGSDKDQMNSSSSLPQDPESESDDEPDNWADVITLDDDDDDDQKEQDLTKGRREMICFRCPNLRQGTFKDRNKFLIHFKRHIFGDHFCCLTCGRPFTKLNYCLSHEIRVHDTPIDYDKKDPVISFAKRYVEEKKAKRALRAAAKEQNGGATPNYETDDDEETDCEDPKFYNNLIVSSTTLYKYRGPIVNNNLEMYEIQLNHARPRFLRSNPIAKIAIQAHKLNVENNYDINRLGRFSKTKKKVTVPVPVPTAKKVGKPKQSRAPPTASLKRQLSDGSDVECTNNNPKKKKIRYKYITSSSSSSSSEDESDSEDRDYQPTKNKSRVSGVENESTTSDSNDDQLPQSSRSRQKKDKRQIREITRQLVPALIVRVCQQCNYVWETEVDLRTHRDAMHPNVPLSALLPVIEIKEKRRCRIKQSEPKLVKPSSETSPVNTAAPPKKQRRRGNASQQVGKDKKAAKGKQIPTTALGPTKLCIPIPNSTFSEKEKFLYRFGLINVVRLNVFQNKGKNVELPDCYVELDKLDPSLIPKD